jgi:hypothetical protein
MLQVHEKVTQEVNRSAGARMERNEIRDSVKNGDRDHSAPLDLCLSSPDSILLQLGSYLFTRTELLPLEFDQEDCAWFVGIDAAKLVKTLPFVIRRHHTESAHVR